LLFGSSLVCLAARLVTEHPAESPGVIL